MSSTSPTAAPVPQPAPERVLVRLRRHARVLILPALLLVVVAGGATYLVAIVDEDWQRWAVLGAAALVVAAGSGLPYLAWLTRRTTVTTRRIIVRSGIFVRTRRDVLHAVGYQVVVRRTPMQRLFGTGDLRIESGGDRPLVLVDVPSPGRVQAALHELVERSPDLAFRGRRPGPSADGDTVAFGTR
ncbi:PH domain-containing protein [Agromyces sp. MMS24-K17]|uniref:PH domain-containing protein n=1 Tax=Agromyces sp. MMS24-K17 TaxID=3372850 RepID=UPI003754FD13